MPQYGAVYSNEKILESRLILAHFSDQNYKTSQRSLVATKQMLANTVQELATFASSGVSIKSAPIGVRKRYAQLRNRKKWEEQELDRIQKESLSFLEKAASNYMHCLQSSDSHDVQIFRVCNLWFSNPNTDTVRKQLQRIPF